MKSTFFAPNKTALVPPITLILAMVGFVGIALVGIVGIGIVIAYGPNPTGLFRAMAPAPVTTAIVVVATLLYGFAMAVSWILLTVAWRRSKT